MVDHPANRTDPASASEDRLAILDDLKIVKRIVSWAVGVGGAALVAWMVVMISDHFLLARTAADFQEQKPRIEKMWWNSPYANAK